MLPTWDLDSLFPTVDGPEATAAEAALGQAIDGLAELCDRHDVRGNGAGGTDERADPAAFDAVLAALNDVLDRFARLESFAYGHVSTDSGNEAA
ncbi:MAG TPA: hypothetical protein VF015_08500, partial [Acidimicrobiales bacterium]